MSPAEIDTIRRALVDRALQAAESGNRTHVEHTIGVIRGLLWALTGSDPSERGDCGDLCFVLTEAGIPWRTLRGTRIEFALPGEDDWPTAPPDPTPKP